MVGVCKSPTKPKIAKRPPIARNPTTLSVTAHQDRLERAERELARVRRELAASPDATDAVVSE